MPLSTLPRQPKYWRCTPGVCSPHFWQLVSSITPTVPSGSSGRASSTSATRRWSLSRAASCRQSAVTRNSWRMRTAVPASTATCSMLLRGRPHSKHREALIAKAQRDFVFFEERFPRPRKFRYGLKVPLQLAFWLGPSLPLAAAILTGATAVAFRGHVNSSRIEKPTTKRRPPASISRKTPSFYRC